MNIHKLKVDTSRFGREEIVGVRRVRLTPAGCALDLGDGSERGEYVNQDYILNKLGRPHRCIGLMYTYYPKDKEWPARSSEAYPDLEVHGQWDYPYDDYFVYGGGIGGSRDADVFQQMRDVRRHGQDVMLTLTIDCSVSDEHLIQIAKDLRSFGRLRLRINHECAGDWFTHNRRYSYQEVADFFVRFHRIIKEHAPNVSTIFCSGLIEDDGKMKYEKEFLEAYKSADIWSADQYLALHYGWPFDVCEKEDLYETFTFCKVDEYIDKVKRTMAHLKELNGGSLKPFSASEFNTDGDVTGPRAQGEGLLAFAEYLVKEKPEWYNSMSMYQFRDRGRLGLELEDPNNSSEGIELPLLDDYKKVMNEAYFQPGIEVVETIEIQNADVAESNQDNPSKESEKGSLTENKTTENKCLEERRIAEPIRIRWGGTEDSEGVELKVKLEGDPVFFDMELPKDMNLMISVRGRWFYKSSGVGIIDVMPAFFAKDAKPVTSGEEISILLFAPPADGENPETGDEDWAVNYYTELPELPKLRIRYEACGRTV